MPAREDRNRLPEFGNPQQVRSRRSSLVFSLVLLITVMAPAVRKKREEASAEES
jgi:hypothetical protein